MTDRVYPSSAPKPPAAAATQTLAPTKTTGTLPTVVNPPPNKASTLYNPNRLPYRPNPNTRHAPKPKRRSARRCVCMTCFWVLLILLAIVFLAIIAGAAFYVLYHPERPTFSVTSLKISSFNMTKNSIDDSTHLTTKLNLTVSVKNTNKKIVFFYDPVSVSVMSREVMIGSGGFENFTSSSNSVIVMHTVMGTTGQVLAPDDLEAMENDMKRKTGLPMNIVVDTNVGVKMEKLRMRKVGIRVKCEGVHGVVPKGRIVSPVVANTVKAECKVDLRVKIWKFTF